MRSLALVASVAVLTAAGPGTPRPALRVVDDDPLTVRGLRFAPRERVKLLVSTPPSAFSRSVRAGTRGGFVVRLGISLDACTATVVQAVGARGSRATLHLDAVHCTSP